MPTSEPKFGKLPQDLPSQQGQSEHGEEIGAGEQGQRRKALLTAGFSDEDVIKYLTRYTTETIREHVQDLTDAGFKDPVKAVEKHPQLAGLDIKRVIQDLTDAGFKDPVKAVEKHPQLAGYDIKRVERRIRLTNKLIKLYQLEGMSGVELGQTYPGHLFGASAHKLNFVFRTLRETTRQATVSPPELIKLAYRALMTNPYLLFRYLRERKAWSVSVADFKGILREITKLKKQEKKETIHQEKEQLTANARILKEGRRPYDTFLSKLAHNLELLKESREKKQKRSKT